MVDTDDLVQDVIIGALARLQSIELREDGLLQYLKTSILNRVRNIVRDHMNRQKLSAAQESSPAVESPFDSLVSRADQAKYEAGLARLSREDQELVIARIEFGMSYKEIAIHEGKPSADAARMACKRAIERLANNMRV